MDTTHLVDASRVVPDGEVTPDSIDEQAAEAIRDRLNATEVVGGSALAELDPMANVVMPMGTTRLSKGFGAKRHARPTGGRVDLSSVPGRAGSTADAVLKARRDPRVHADSDLDADRADARARAHAILASGARGLEAEQALILLKAAR